MLVVDGHLDLAMNALYCNRDLTRSAHELRAAEVGRSGEGGLGRGTVGLPDMRRGGVGLCFATVIARARPGGKDSIDFGNQTIAYAQAQGQLAFYREMERPGRCG